MEPRIQQQQTHGSSATCTAAAAPSSVVDASLLLSFPTHMESTSEVMLAGLDLFYARFAPSTAYDMLPDEFQKQVGGWVRGESDRAREGGREERVTASESVSE